MPRRFGKELGALVVFCYISTVNVIFCGSATLPKLKLIDSDFFLPACFHPISSFILVL